MTRSFRDKAFEAGIRISVGWEGPEFRFAPESLLWISGLCTHLEDVDSHVKLTTIIDWRFIQERNDSGIKRLVAELQHVPEDSVPSALERIGFCIPGLTPNTNWLS